MIIALLVIMFIILVVLYNVIDKIKEGNEYYLKCIKLMNDMDVTLLDKINDLEKTVEELELAIDAINKYTHERINDTNERVDKIEETVKGIQVLISTPKSCNINGECKYQWL